MGPTRARVTMIDIAREAGVSKSTVSLVLQGSALVRPETADKIHAAIRSLGYVYNRGAANLRRARSNIVGVMISDLSNPFFVELAIGVERVFRVAGYVPFLANTSENQVRQADVLRAMREQGVAGVIASPARGSAADAFDGLLDDGRPVVLAMRKVAGCRAALVAPENRAGAAEATRHLLALGHRRIAFLGGYEDVSIRRERVEGFLAALREAGVEPGPVLGSTVSRAGGAEAMAEALTRADPPTAALCFNDVVAFGAMLGLRRAGLEAGRDIAVVGFDDLQEAALVTPALSTVAIDPQSIGERAAQTALRMIETGRTTGEELRTPARLVVRESCGAAARTEGKAA